MVKIIAEIGSSWLPAPGTGLDAKQGAIRAIELAAKAGANVVKFQLFDAYELYSVDRAGQEQVDRLEQFELPYLWLQDLRKVADESGVILGASVFDEDDLVKLAI